MKSIKHRIVVGHRVRNIFSLQNSCQLGKYPLNQVESQIQNQVYNMVHRQTLSVMNLALCYI